MIAKVHDMQWMRGDTTRIGISIAGLDGTPDALTFSVKKYKTDTEYIIRKTLSNGIEPETAEEGLRYVVTIEPADTDELEFGEYYFDIQVTANGVKQTTCGTLRIEREVTFAENEV